MKNLFKYNLLIIALLIVSCDEGFDDLNINKNAATSINPAFILNNAIINTSFVATTVQYEMGIVQQMISPNSGVLTGANYNQDNREATNQNWVRFYRSVIRNTVDVIQQTKDVPARSNLNNMAKILQSFGFMILTDSYGDIPYFEAGKGYLEQVTYPKYDAQKDIYADITKTISDATAALDASKTIETSDLLYGGDITKWKKFGNSLLLRAGMRLVKIDPALAQSTVQKAVAGGLMTANSDNAVIRHDANYTNGVGQMLNSTEAANFYITAPFVDYLKRTADPRLRAFAVRYVGAKSGPEQTAAKASQDTSLQIGMPMGLDNTGAVAEAAKQKLASFYDFSQVDRTRFAKNTASMFILTYSQTSLLLAEAIQRGWATGSASDAFKNGVRAHMEECAAHDAGSAVPAADITKYLDANPYDAAKGLEQINTQYWVSSFMNGPEVFANFRRSGFPKLAPNPFAGKAIKGEFIRRLTYPNSEISVNSTNVKAAIARQGADDLDTRVWWDKQ